jgi:hypothetical protein
VSQKAAWSIFDKDCLVRLGTVVSAAGTANPDEPVMTVELEMPDRHMIKDELKFGEIRRIPLAERQEAKAVITPQKKFDMGSGPGHKIEGTIMGGVVCIVLDARGRPFHLPEEEEARKEMLMRWFETLSVYPKDELKKMV